MNRVIVDQIQNNSHRISSRYYKQIYVNEYEIANNVAFFSEENGYPLLNLNLLVSEKLKDIPSNRRSYKVVDFVTELILSTREEIICIDNFEILFEPTLRIDPFDLFNDLSKNKTLIIAWRGSIKNDVFIYAEPGHPEYKKHSTKDALIIQ